MIRNALFSGLLLSAASCTAVAPDEANQSGEPSAAFRTSALAAALQQRPVGADHAARATHLVQRGVVPDSPLQHRLLAAGAIDVELQAQQPWLVRLAPGAVKAADATQSIAALFDVPATGLRLVKSELDTMPGAAPVNVLRYAYQHQGLPVVGGDMVVLSASDGSITSIVGKARAITVSPQPALPLGDALVLAQVDYQDVGGVAAQNAGLVYFVDGENVRLAHKIAVRAQGGLLDDALPIFDYVFIDAHTGEQIAVHPQIHAARNRRTYSANNGNNLPGALVLGENDTTAADPVVMTLHANVAKAYDCVKAAFNRDSYNNAGVTITATARVSQKYNNAFWDGAQLAFGDGDGVVFSPLVVPDVVTHEFAHAITTSTSNLEYARESGALNEAMSDIVASICQARETGAVTDATWLLGEEVWTPGKNGDAMRYMASPTLDGVSKDHTSTMIACNQPTNNNDMCYVHTNSGIPNVAFKMLVTGGKHPRAGVGAISTTVTVPKLGLERASKIAYRAWTQYMTSTTNFVQARAAFKQAATDLYPTEAGTIAAAELAWYAVGVGNAIANLPTGADDPNAQTPPPSTGGTGNGNGTSGSGNGTGGGNGDGTGGGNGNNGATGDVQSNGDITGGCSSTQGGAAPTGAWLLLALAALVRRRRRVS